MLMAPRDRRASTQRRAIDWPGQTAHMGIQYDDLPRWEFTVATTSPGIYRVLARRDGGIAGEGTGLSFDTLLADLRVWAQKIEVDLEWQAQRPAQPSSPPSSDGATVRPGSSKRRSTPHVDGGIVQKDASR